MAFEDFSLDQVTSCKESHSDEIFEFQQIIPSNADLREMAQFCLQNREESDVIMAIVSKAGKA